MVNVGVFCGDYHSIFKPYFRWQVSSFERTRPVVFTWSKSESDVDESDVLRIRFPWNPGRLRSVVAKAMNRLGVLQKAGSRSEVRWIREQLVQQKVDVAILHSGFVAHRVMESALLAGVPTIIYLHGGDLSQARKNQKWQRRLSRLCCSAECVVVVGHYMVAQVMNLGIPRDNIFVIPVGALVTERDYKLGGANREFVFVGRLVECKGVDSIIDAVAFARSEGEDISLRIIGEGPEEQSLKDQAVRLAVHDLVSFEGAQDSGFVNSALDDSGGLVIHTVDEPGGPEAFGVVVTEAMAAARPAIVSRCGGLVDQIINGEHGFVIEQRDVEALAGAMIRLGVDEVLRAEMGLAARQRAERLFDARDLGRRLEELALRVLA